MAEKNKVKDEKLKIKFITFGEMAVLANAVLICTFLFLWISPYFSNFKTSKSTTQHQIERIEDVLRFDIAQTKGEIQETIKLLKENLALDSVKDLQNLAEESLNIRKFDQILWIKKQQKKLKAFPLLAVKSNIKNDAYNFDLNKPDKSIMSSLLNFANKGQAGKIITNFSPEHTSMFTKDLSNNQSMLIQPFTVNTKIYSDNGELLGFIIGITRSDKAFNLTAFQNIDEITYLTLNNSANGVSIIAYSKALDSIAKLFGKTTNYNNQLDGWEEQSSFTYNLETFEFTSNKALSYTPYAILILGILYSLIIFSSVRSNRIKRFTALHEKDELIKHTITLGHDASEKAELEDLVNHVEQKNIALLNSINDIIIECDDHAVVTFVNGAWNRVTELDSSTCLERKLFDIIRDEDIEHHKKEFLMLIRGHKEQYSFSTQLLCKDDTLKDVDVVLTKVQFNDPQKDARIVATITNMQERNQAQRALIEVEERYKSVWDRAAFGLFQLSADGSYVSTNPSFYKILGYSSFNDLQGSVNDANKQVYANYRERMKFLRTLEQHDEIKNWEAQVKKKDGSLIWINESSILVRDDKGVPQYIEGSIEDITDRVEATDSLQQAKMESDMANRAKSEFLANMSHELRTPLNSIIGFSEILRDEVMGPIGQRSYWEYARDINKSGQRLLRIINEILDISRIETGERELNDSSVDLKKLSEKCIDILSGKITNSELNLIIDIDDDTPNIMGEELAIKQMIMNILSNAIKFTPSGGKITISTEVEDRGSLRLSITDTGIGIKNSEIEKALSPFSQLDGDDLGRHNSGTGLGLTLVNALIKMHNGQLELVSEKGIGTTATLIFPLDRVLPKSFVAEDISSLNSNVIDNVAKMDSEQIKTPEPTIDIQNDNDETVTETEATVSTTADEVPPSVDLEGSSAITQTTSGENTAVTATNVGIQEPEEELFPFEIAETSNQIDIAITTSQDEVTPEPQALDSNPDISETISNPESAETSEEETTEETQSEHAESPRATTETKVAEVDKQALLDMAAEFERELEESKKS